MKKYLTVIPFFLLFSALLLQGCQNTQKAQTPSPADPIADTEQTTTNTVNTASEDIANNNTIIPTPTEFVTEEYMTQADMWKVCDDTALAAVMKKAAAGESVTIACIGGSITQGTISSGTDDSSLNERKCYADIFFSWWESTFPDTEFTFINAGIGATDSYLGVHRVGKDVLEHHPDLVLVEFSVNDGSSVTDKRNYDNLVRRILLSENAPAVMLLFMGQTNGASAQDIHANIGFNYKLPMVSYMNVLSAMLSDGTYKEKQLSGDTTHPSALGHAITGEILWKYLNNVYMEYETFGEPIPFTKEAVTNDVFLDSEILDNITLVLDETGTFTEGSAFANYKNGWSNTGADSSLTFTVTCNRLGFLYLCTTDGKSGQFDVYVDDEYTGTLNADFKGGWGNYAKAQEIFVGEDVAEHVITIKKAENSQSDIFTLLGVLVAQ